MVAFAADLLAGGYPRFASFSDRLAVDASFEADRYNRKRIFSFHQSLIHAPRQSSPRLNDKILSITAVFTSGVSFYIMCIP